MGSGNNGPVRLCNELELGQMLDNPAWRTRGFQTFSLNVLFVRVRALVQPLPQRHVWVGSFSFQLRDPTPGMHATPVKQSKTGQILLAGVGVFKGV